MFINNLKIKNFKNIKEVDLDFDKITLLSGDTGSGKTAIIEALTLLKTNYLQDKLQEYIRWDQPGFEIEDTFQHKGKKFNYKIDVSKTTKRYLDINSDVYKQSEASSKLDEYINSKLTLFSNISLQGRSSELLFETPAPRLKKIKQIFNVDKLQESIDRIKEDIEENKNKIIQLESDINAVSSIEFNFLDDVEIPDIDIELLDAEIVELEKQQKDFLVNDEKYKQYLKDKKVYDDSLTYINIINQENEQLDNKIIELQSKIQEIEKYDNSEYSSIFENIETNKKIVSDFKILNDLQEESKKIKIKRVGRLSEDDLKDKLKQLKITIDENSSNIKSLKSSKDLVIQGKCPTCQQDYVSDLSADEIQIKINTAIQDNKKLSIEYDNYDEQLETLRKVTAENVYILKTKKDIDDKIEKLNNELKDFDLATIESLLQTLNNRKIQLEELNIKRARIEKENEAVKNEIQSLETKVSINNSKFIDLQNVQEPEIVKKVTFFDESKLNVKKQDKNNYIILTKEKDNIEEHNAKIRKQQEENLLKISEYEKSLYEKRNENVLLKECYNLLNKDFSSYLIDKGTAYIKNKMNDFFQKSYGKYFIEFKQDSSGIEFFYSEDGTNLHPVSMLSGFEKQIFSVSFRLALCSLQNLNFLILDEVDSDSSSDKSLQMFKTILEEEWIEQLFIVSHKDETKDYLSSLPNSKMFEFKNGEVLN